MANKRIDNQSRVMQYQAIKARLNKKFGESGLTINKLKDELNNLCDFQINYDTLRKTLDSTTNTLDIYCVIAMCKYFNIDTAYVLSEANNSANEILYEEAQYTSEKFAELDDPKYWKKHFGYLYSPKKGNESIDTFCMEIKKEGTKLVAHLEITYHTTSLDGKESTGTKKLTGRPVLVKPQGIYIVFTESSGSYYIFSYSYVQYNIRDLYFRRGSIITQGRDASRQPMMQSFVLFDAPVAEEEREVIKGMLLLSDNMFHISSKEIEDLAAENERVAYLINNLKYIFNENCEQYYLVDEAQILHSLKNCMSRTEAVRVLQLMKARATDAKRIYFPESDDYSEFSKEIKKKQV